MRVSEVKRVLGIVTLHSSSDLLVFVEGLVPCLAGICFVHSTN